MVMYIPKEEARKALPHIEDPQMFKAVDLALWLILEKGKALKYAIDIAANKHGANPKAAIERYLRMAIPPEFFWERAGSARPKGVGAVSKSAAIRGQKMKKMEQEGKKHVSDISKR